MITTVRFSVEASDYPSLVNNAHKKAKECFGEFYPYQLVEIDAYPLLVSVDRVHTWKADVVIEAVEQEQDGH